MDLNPSRVASLYPKMEDYDTEEEYLEAVEYYEMCVDEAAENAMERRRNGD